MPNMYLLLQTVESWDLKDHAKLTEVLTGSEFFIILCPGLGPELVTGHCVLTTIGAIHQSLVAGHRPEKMDRENLVERGRDRAGLSLCGWQY